MCLKILCLLPKPRVSALFGFTVNVRYLTARTARNSSVNGVFPKRFEVWDQLLSALISALGSRLITDRSQIK